MELHYSAPGTQPSPLRLDPGALRATVEVLSFPRVFGTSQNARAEQLITAAFKEKLGASFIQGKTRNVCSGDPATARLLVGAHYDSVLQTPGADDNASGIAVLLALAGIVGPRAGVLYVAFNGEECGLAGSREFVDEMADTVAQLQQVHVLEMVGYRDRRPGSQKNPVPGVQSPTVGDFLGVVSNRAALVDRIVEKAGGIDVPVVGLAVPEEMPLATIRQWSPHLLRSDHAGFWERGLSAAMWTDTAEFRNPHYHLPSDTPDTLDYEFMAEVGKLAAMVLLSDLQPVSTA